ncbi:hypothetical protein [Algoriphagus namhaensis]
MKKFLFGLLFFVLLLGLVAVVYGFIQFRDRHEDYWLDLSWQAGELVPIKAGFAKVDITPNLTDTWEDVNGDARYNPEDGDTYTDVNGNGQFDGVWLAGFHNGRAAQGVLDPLWARAMVLDDGEHQLALCVIDMIGFGNDEVIATRKMIEESNPEIDYVIISSTHVHSSPDLMGLWGSKDFDSGVDAEYLTQVQRSIESAINQAFAQRKTASFKFTQEDEKLKAQVGDTRDPQVFDSGLKLMQVLDQRTGQTLGTLMNWGNHPETLWLENTLITSDFPHPWREMVENGIVKGDSVLIEGVGGVAIFLNGAIGGLMTTHPDMTLQDPFSGATYQKQNTDKYLAQGRALAKYTLETLRDSAAVQMKEGSLALRAKSLELRMDNSLFHLAAFLGILDRGFTQWKHIRSEISAWTLGPATFVHVPGELYPEILHGGVEAPEGGDFGIAPVEVPALQSQIPGQFKFFAGMSNDMIGYIIPKSQWDVKPPFTYGKENRPYGEINSLGPETGPTIHRETIDLLKDLRQNE